MILIYRTAPNLIERNAKETIVIYINKRITKSWNPV
jgi:hypothetical protein